MERARAVVIAVEGRLVRVEAERASACRRCAAGRGCGAGLLTGDRRTQLDIALPHGEPVPASGDRVELLLPPSSLLRLSAWMYGLPLVLAAAAAVVATLLGAGDGGSAGAAAVGLAAGLLAARRRFSGCLEDYSPTLVTGP